MSYAISPGFNTSLLTLACAISAAFALGASCGDGKSGSGGASDVEICANLVDDDDDDLADCDDSDCDTHPECTLALDCSGVDPGDGDKNALCSEHDDCDSERCCLTSPGDCNNPFNLCTCRDPN